MIITTLAASLAGCDAGVELVGRHSAAIVNGSETLLFPAVGALVSGDSSGCTATLIGKRTVLTAAHCVVGKWPIAFYAGGFEGPEYVASSVHIHPDYAGGNKADIAVVRLAQPASVQALPLAQRAPAVGEDVMLLGLGRTSETDDSFGTKRRTFNKVGKIDEEIVTFYGSDGNKGNVCDGDSGGPTLAARAGEQVVIGVHSTKGGVCGQQGHDMRVDVFRGWIEEVAGGDVTAIHASDAQPPMVEFVKPANAALVGSSFPSLVTAADDKSVVEIAFYVDGVLQGKLEQAPYQYNFHGVEPGLHTIVAVARDAAGRSASAVIQVKVVGAASDEIGRYCETALDCASGICAHDVLNDRNFCTRSCSLDGDDCPGSLGCVSTGETAVCALEPVEEEAKGCSVSGTSGAAGLAPLLLLLALGLCRRRAR